MNAIGQNLKVREACSTENGGQHNPGREWFLSIMQRANEVSGAPDSSGMILDMLDLLIEAAQADSAYFYQHDAVTDELVITHVRGDAESQYLIGLRLNRKQGFPGIFMGEHNIMVVGDLPSDPDWLSAVDPVSAARKRNVINLLITHQKRTLGVVQLFNYQQADVGLLSVLGNRLAVEMDRSKEVEATRQANQRLLTLVDILGEVAGTLDRNRLLHLVTENASRLVDAERSSIFLVNPNTREMLFQVAYQSSEQELSPSSDGSIDRNAKTNVVERPVRKHSSTKSKTSHFQTGEFSFFNRSAITVPLRSAPPTSDRTEDYNHLLGGLMVLNKQNAAFQEEDAHLMQILADQTSTFLQVAEMYESAGELFLGVIKALITAIEAKDPYTQGHSQRVSDYSVQISQELGLDEALLNDIRIGSLFHDIGKIGIPDSILLKTEQLTDKEYEVIKQHPRTGEKILSQVKLLEAALPAISEHHERLDGSGYPARLVDSQISWMGRIVAVADVYDAMTSNRPYRLALKDHEVLAYLYENAGTLFDIECIQALDHIIARSSEGVG